MKKKYLLAFFLIVISHHRIMGTTLDPLKNSLEKLKTSLSSLKNILNNPAGKKPITTPLNLELLANNIYDEIKELLKDTDEQQKKFVAAFALSGTKKRNVLRMTTIPIMYTTGLSPEKLAALQKIFDHVIKQLRESATSQQLSMLLSQTNDAFILKPYFDRGTGLLMPCPFSMVAGDALSINPAIVRGIVNLLDIIIDEDKKEIKSRFLQGLLEAERHIGNKLEPSQQETFTYLVDKLYENLSEQELVQSFSGEMATFDVGRKVMDHIIIHGLKFKAKILTIYLIKKLFSKLSVESITQIKKSISPNAKSTAAFNPTTKSGLDELEKLGFI